MPRFLVTMADRRSGKTDWILGTFMRHIYRANQKGEPVSFLWLAPNESLVKWNRQQVDEYARTMGMRRGRDYPAVMSWQSFVNHAPRGQGYRTAVIEEPQLCENDARQILRALSPYHLEQVHFIGTTGVGLTHVLNRLRYLTVAPDPRV